ncbi:MAG TPA: TIGR03643 family protein [Cytophagales bacterium]|nr:TIGR03643 family protein [Cytophagales bacterium]HAA18642.1 TIGR03643 family protein [Cytophagales bacterium]HAP64582.1 TIGR03643 family protein [Cytophagales bacterium]
MKISVQFGLSEVDVDRIIEMAWEDRTTFDAIDAQFGLNEQAVITLMRQELKPASWRRWRKRVQNRSTKHRYKRSKDTTRFKANRQRDISNNRIT